MSNLGGNSPSADTDKANNLVGPPGADSTVPGPEGPASTVPGPPGNDGVVATVVGGTNCSVDSADAANPIINADDQNPVTTKGDLSTFSTVEARLPVGTDSQQLVADAAEATGLKWVARVIDISAFVQGAPTDAEKLATFVATKAFTLPSGLTASKGFAEVVSTAAATIDVQVNAVSKGTINFALGVATATFTFASPVVIAAGDRIQFIAQGTADATLADISFTIRGDI